jgi:O-antigen ligase
MAFFYVRKRGLKRRLVITAAIVSLALLALPDFYDRLFARIETAQSGGGSGRLYVWQASLASLKEFGIVGAGLANFQSVYAQYAGEAGRFFAKWVDNAHNIYLTTWVELGIVGLVLLLMALGSSLRAAGRLGRTLGARFATSILPHQAACWSALTAAFFVGLLWRKSFWLVWIMLALALRAVKNETMDADQPQE